jgi:predicted TIM-barrel fold metal-dependent hydrolase
VFSEASDTYLAKLNDAGVRGARFSFRQELGAVLSDKDFARAIARMRELGWYAKIQPEKDGIVSSAAKYENLDLPVLIDHMARPDPVHGKEDPNLQKMLELLSKGNFWVMLSLGEKTSKKGKPWDDAHNLLMNGGDLSPLNRTSSPGCANGSGRRTSPSLASRGVLKTKGRSSPPMRERTMLCPLRSLSALR